MCMKKLTQNKSHIYQRAKSFLICFIIFAPMFALQPINAFAQTSPNPANCEELTDPDTKFQMELCSAHLGCRMVMNIHSTCVKAKKFITNLKDAIGEGTKGLFGIKKEITPEAVFDASNTDSKNIVDLRSDARAEYSRLRNEVKVAKKNEITGLDANGVAWVFYGESTQGKPFGRGTTFYANGFMERTNYEHGTNNGVVDQIGSDGSRYIGRVWNGVRDSNKGLLVTAEKVVQQGTWQQGTFAKGVQLNPDGTRFVGVFDKDGRYLQGDLYAMNGSLFQTGKFLNQELEDGKIFDASGSVAKEINLPRDRELAAAKSREADDKRKRDLELERQASEQRKREAEAVAERAYRNSLNAMNAGQLFAKADELSAQGDSAKARETLRLLVSKFPDHALAAAAAQQMATMSAASANSSSGGANNSSSSSGAVSNISAQSNGGGKCWDILAKKDKEYEAINRRPVPQGATPGLMRVMWMTEDSIKVIDANCAGDAKAAKYRAELETAYNQAKTACGQLTAGGQCKANAF